jgi:hypothetical protein
MKSRVVDHFSLFGEREDITYHIFPENQENGTVDGESLMNFEEFVRIRALKDSSGEENKLFVNHVWEGSIVLTDFIVTNSDLFVNKSTLELGAGTALPSIVVSKFFPSVVVASDFPDENLLNHIKMLSVENKCENFFVEPHKWGGSVDNLLSHLAGGTSNTYRLFDNVFLAELLWKDTVRMQNALLSSVKRCLKPVVGKAYCCFAKRYCEGFTEETVNRFFSAAENTFGFSVELLETNEKYKDAMENVSITVYLYALTLPA